MMCTRCKSWVVRVAVLTGVVAVLLLWNSHILEATPGNILWSAPHNLSNTLELSANPAVVADGFGYVHIFWSEEVGGRARRSGDQGGSGNTIFYTRWDGMSWMPPIDVLFVPGEEIADFIAVDVDEENRLHIVWTGQANFYYSNALSWQAGSAHAWSTPIILATDSARSSWEVDISANAFGGLHVVYATRGDIAGIYHIRSLDGGESWSPPLKLSNPFGPRERSFSRVKLIVDDMDYLHTVWQTTQIEGYGQSVYYARSVDGGVHWSAPWQFGYRDPGDIFVEYPYLAVRGDMEIHLIYIDGGTRGRLHRISLDNGATWSEPRYIVPELEGINGYVIPLVDGAGGMHLIANMRTLGDNVVGVYYARWDGEGWSPAVPLDNSSPAAPTAHYSAATVRLGNEIYIVYNQISIGEIWMLRGVLSFIQPTPAAMLPYPEAQMPRALILDGSQSVPTLVPNSIQLKPEWRSLPYEQAPALNVNAVVLGLIASILLVSVIAVRTYVQRRRRIY